MTLFECSIKLDELYCRSGIYDNLYFFLDDRVGFTAAFTKYSVALKQIPA